MGQPYAIKEIRNWLLTLSAVTSALDTATSIYAAEFPSSIEEPGNFIVIQEVPRITPSRIVRMNRSDHPRSVSTQVKCFGRSLDQAYRVYMALDDAISGRGNVASGSVTFWEAIASSGPSPLIDPDLPEVDGKEWWYILAFYDWRVFAGAVA